MDHDSGYRQLFSHPQMIRDLLHGYVEEPWVAHLDFST
ncbi:MAG: transposase, partial [Pseudomonadota bacterium]